jgi:hypothetical protein
MTSSIMARFPTVDQLLNAVAVSFRDRRPLRAELWARRARRCLIGWQAGHATQRLPPIRVTIPDAGAARDA